MRLYKVSLEGAILQAFIAATSFTAASAIATRTWGVQVEGLVEVHGSTVLIDWNAAVPRGV